LASKGEEMKEFDERIALRLTGELREKATELINRGKYKNLSEVVRASLQQFLKQNHKELSAE
jgi:Arc/MetJ-type ribon-helix-helix transcriptional regulator